jgi:phosphoribosyl-ATP pyrophosphohydrolase
VSDTSGLLGAPAEPHVPGIGEVLAEIYGVLEQRKRDLPEDSYTAKLLMGPQDKILKKIGEEATEVVIAARDEDATQLRYELGDLFYHLMVLMVREGVGLADIAAELHSRRRK